MNLIRPVVLVTGASSGIGKAFSETFASNGYDVVLASRSFGKLERLARDLKDRFQIDAIALEADLETTDGPSRLHAALQDREIRIAALVNNAGFAEYGEFRNTDLAKELSMMQLNMTSLVALTKLFLPDLVHAKGKLLNVASTAAFQPGPYMAVYYATKAFVLSFTEAIAEELSGSDVTVTALCPGPTASGFQSRANMQSSALIKDRKLPGPEEVANAGYRALIRGQRVVIPGTGNWLLAQSVRLLPRRTVARLVKSMSRPA